MIGISKETAARAAVSVAVCAFMLLWTRSSAQAPRNPSSDSVKPLMAEQYFKNVQLLRGIPVDEFMGTMGFIAAATGMNCSQCHVEASGGDWARYADDTPLKQTARKMILMVRSINQTNFGGRPEVTCYSCHRGGTLPKVVPDLTEQYAVPPPVDPEEIADQSADAPSVDQVLNSYIQALGGAQKLAKLSSFIVRANYQSYDDPQQYPVEIYAKAPGQRTTIMHTPDGDNTAACDGTSAWTAAPQSVSPQPVLTLTGQDLDGALFDSQLFFPQEIKQTLSNWKVGPISSIDEHQVRIIQGTGKSGALIKLYFDSKSGLLVRQERTANTPIGRIPTRVDYSDYRDVSGIKIPFHWTVTWTDGRNVFEVAQVLPNASVDEAKFAMPAPSKLPATK